jgi:uncharacterized membrane protein YeaQ/YmgE (transglycosylase-associated protein family)
MAWDNKDDVLGQIFDFIFAQQELPPEKRKPVDASGVDGNKELVDAVAAVLENPAKFNVEVMADEYKDAVNLKLAELRFSEDNIKKAEFGTANLSEIITDPVGYARKIRETTKAIRKSMRAKYLGAMSTEFVVSAYLRKQGFSKELRDIIKNDRRFQDSIKQLYEFSDYKDAQAYAQGVSHPPMLSGADKEYVNSRSATLKAKMSMSKSNWESLTDNQKDTLTKNILINEADKTPAEMQNVFRSVLGTTQGDKVFNRYLKYNKNRDYHILETYNLGREANVVRKNHYHNGRWDSEEAKLAYERTNVAKDFIKYSQEFSFIEGRKTPELLANSREYLGNINTQITDLKNDLKRAQRSGNTRAERLLREQLKMTQSAKSTMLQVMVVGNIGRIEGYFNSIKDHWNLAAVINGDFFNPKKNQFNTPTQKYGFAWDKQGTDDGRIVSEIMVPTYLATGRGRAFDKVYDEFFTQVYYMTPASIFKTFFYNGEGFAWRAYRQKQKIEEYVKGLNLSGFNLTAFQINKSYREAVLSGTTGITNQRLLDMLRKYERQGNLSKMFSTMYRIQEDLLGKIDKQVIQKFRQKIFDSITNSRWFLRIKDSSVSVGLLKNWVKTGGLRNLIKGLSQAIASALGVAVTPIFNLIVGSVVGWISERLYDLAVPLFGVIVYAILGIVGIFVLVIGGLRANNVNYNIAASTPPGEVGYCDIDSSNYPENTEFWGEPIHVPPPINSSCPLGDTPYVCTQGFTNTTCTHVNIKHKKPVDIDGAGANIKYFYAPDYCDSSNCTASSVINPSRCSDGNYTGQWVTFNDGNGNIFTLGHTKLIPPSNGRNYSAGEPVAYVYQNAAELIADDPEHRTSGSRFYCWTGSHIHLLITQNGKHIDPLSFLYEMGCTNGPVSEEQCPPCH